jgi:hypothetical protein
MRHPHPALSTVRDAIPENTPPQKTTPVEDNPAVVETPQAATPLPATPVAATPVITTPQTAIPLETAPQATAPKTATATTKTSFMPPRVHALVIVLILAGIGVWIGINESSGKNTSTTNSFLPEKEKDNTGQDDNGITVTRPPANNIQAEDFAGTWRAYEATGYEEDKVRIGNPDDDLIIEVSNGSFKMYSRNDSHDEEKADVNCREVVGNTINCYVKDKTDPSGYNLKMEMEDSKNEMTITIVQEGSTQTLVLKARRV